MYNPHQKKTSLKNNHYNVNNVLIVYVYAFILYKCKCMCIYNKLFLNNNHSVNHLIVYCILNIYIGSETGICYFFNIIVYSLFLLK